MEHNVELGTETDGDSALRAAVLILQPVRPGEPWQVVELAAPAEFFAGVASDASDCPTATSALRVAHDLAILISEGRVPAMHEHARESVREFISELERRGYDRESAVRLLLDMVDRRAGTPPKAPRSSARSSRKAV